MTRIFVQCLISVLCLFWSTHFQAAELSTSNGLDIDVVKQMLNEDRTALVVGNAAYKQWPPLANPVNDARSIAKALELYGFKVTLVENGSKDQMENAIRDFGERVKRGGVGLFYYAGHGSQFRGQNYLIPVDADILSEDDIEARGVSAQNVVKRMGKANNRLNIVFLDACRTLPIKRFDRDGAGGLAPMKATGTLIAYATAPNFVAKDGKGTNSPYTKSLVEAITKYPGLKLEDLLKTVRGAVLQETGGVQEPWIESSIGGDFFFNPKEAGKSTVIYNPNTQGSPSTDSSDAKGAEIPRWREVGAGMFVQTTEEFNEGDVRRALTLRDRVQALWARTRDMKNDPKMATAMLPMVTAMTDLHRDCDRFIATKKLDQCDALLKKIEATSSDSNALRQVGQAETKKFEDKAAATIDAINIAVKTGKPSMALAPIIFPNYHGEITQQDLDRGWSIKTGTSTVCARAFSKRARSPELYSACKDEVRAIEALLGKKELEEAKARLDKLERDAGT
jgi:Caspase domain